MELQARRLCFAYFLIPVIIVVRLSLLLVFPCRMILNMSQFCLLVKMRGFDGKCATKSMSTGNPSHSETLNWRKYKDMHNMKRD